MISLIFWIISIFLAGCRFFGAAETLYAFLDISDGSTYIYDSPIIGGTAEKIFVVTNTGDNTATEISGSFLTSYFTFKGGTFPGTSGTCTDTLPPRASCVVVTVFTPGESLDTRTDILKISYGTKNAVRPVQAAGIEGAVLSISDGSIYDYGRVPSGTPMDKAFTVTNTGTATASQISPQSFASYFSYPGTGTCGSTLTAGSTCTLVVRYTPVDFTVATDTIQLNYNNGGGTHTASRAITGTGVHGSGTLDTSFGTLGIRKLELGFSNETLRAAELQSDGKSVHVGSNYIARILTSGGLDTSFHTDGFFDPVHSLYSVKIQTNGKVIAAGVTNGAYAVILRYETNGGLDTSFNTGSSFLTDFAETSGDTLTIRSIALQTDGKLLFAAEDDGSITTTSVFHLVRLLTDGTLDITYATSGYAHWYDPTSNQLGESIRKVFTYDNGQGEKAIVVGKFVNTSASTLPEVARFNSDGSFDTSFQTTGFAPYQTATVNSDILDGVRATNNDLRVISVKNGTIRTLNAYPGVLRLYSDGTINEETVTNDLADDIYSGSYINNGGSAFFIGVGTNGNSSTFFKFGNTFLDTTFGTNGSLRISLSTYTGTAVGSTPTIGGIFLKGDGNYAVEGSALNNGLGMDGFRLSITPTGALDTSFLTNGITRYNNSTNVYSKALDSFVDSTGKIYFAGQAYGGYHYPFVVARFDTIGNLDTSFNTNGIRYIPLQISSTLNNLTLDQKPDGKLFIAGGYTSFKGISLLFSDGQFDTSFMTAGYGLGTWVNYSDAKPTINNMMAVAGTFHGVANGAIARIRTDGNLDTVFGTKGYNAPVFTANGGTYNAIEVQTDGRFITVGSGNNLTQIAIARFLTNGTIDTSFNTKGYTLQSVIGTGALKSVYIGSTGEFYAVGQSASLKFVAVKYLTDGALDTTYGTRGFIYSIGTTASFGMGIYQTDGRQLLFGRAGTNWTGAGFKTNTGTLDTTFATAGFLSLSLGFGTNAPNTSTLQSDGKIVVGGSAYHSSNGSQFAIIRLWP